MRSQSRIAIPRRNQLSIVAFRRTNPPIRPHRLDSSFNRLDPEIQREGKTCQINGQISHPGARSKPAKKTTPPQPTPKSHPLRAIRRLRRARRDKPKSNSNPAALTEANGDANPIHNSPGDLLSMDDIYRAAGILAPRMGYSIRKVADMLASDHLRGVSDEMKRASVLMALDAAGISVDEVLRDAAMRQSAINCYESDQWEHFEEYWAAKACREFAHTVGTRAHHRSVSRTHQTQSRRNRPRKSDFRDVANHEAAGSPAHRRSRGNLLETVPGRNLRRAATRPALPGRHGETGLTQGSPQVACLPDIFFSRGTARRRPAAGGPCPNARTPRACHPTEHALTRLVLKMVNARTHCLVYRTRLIPPTHQAVLEVRPIDGIDSRDRMAAE